MNSEASHQPLTLSIGITAYNESRNIVGLLEHLLSLRTKGFSIDQIIVASDGSTDETVQKIRALGRDSIMVIESEERLGKPARINQILETATADVVALFDADIRIESQDLLVDLMEPFIRDSSVSAVFGLAEPLPPKNILQKILVTGWRMWHGLRLSVPNADMYKCEGTIRAFRKNFYEQILFPNASADDVFPFLYAKKHGYKVAGAPKAVVYYSLPRTYADYRRQAVRFLGSEEIQNDNFGREFAERFYVIKTRHKIVAALKAFAADPIFFSAYLFLWSLPKIASVRKTPAARTALWAIASSTKEI